MRMNSDSETVAINVSMERSLFERIEQLRRRQPVIPSRSEVTRDLIEAALPAAERKALVPAE